MDHLLEVNHLSVEYYSHGTSVRAVRDISFVLPKGKTTALVGESGCGKSTVAQAILGLIMPHEGRVSSGAMVFENDDLMHHTRAQWQHRRGNDISLVFQDPFASLNPVLSIGAQLDEAIIAHDAAMPELLRRERCHEVLRDVMLPDVERMMGAYPHQLSGGQRQRIAIAMAIINHPQLLIADEPTTALDVTIQKEIMDLLDTLKKELSLTILFITHNLPLARQRSEWVMIMKEGEIVERGMAVDVFADPQHSYTRELVKEIPSMRNFA